MCAIVSIIVVLSVTICFFSSNKKDKKIVEHLSNQKYAEDVVANGEMEKYDIAPVATPAVEKETAICIGLGVKRVLIIQCGFVY